MANMNNFLAHLGITPNYRNAGIPVSVTVSLPGSSPGYQADR